MYVNGFWIIEHCPFFLKGYNWILIHILWLWRALKECMELMWIAYTLASNLRCSGGLKTLDIEERFTLWTMKSSHGRLSDVIGRWSRPDLRLHQGKNGRVTTEVEVHKFVFLSLLYPLPWSNGFSVGTSKRGGLGKIARAHVKEMPF